MGEEQWWEEEEWQEGEQVQVPTEGKGGKEEEEDRPLGSLTLGSKTEREMEVEFATLYRGGKPVNRNVRIQAKEQRNREQRLGGLQILTERDLKEW